MSESGEHQHEPVDYRGTPQEAKIFKIADLSEELQDDLRAFRALRAASSNVVKDVVEEPKAVPMPEPEIPQEPVDYRGTPNAAGVFKIPEQFRKK
jgi:hypothetical protein